MKEKMFIRTDSKVYLINASVSQCANLLGPQRCFRTTIRLGLTHVGLKQLHR